MKLLNICFHTCIPKNEFFRESLDISRATATKYLKLLEKEGFIVSEQLGKEVIYKNVQLLNLIKE